MIGVYPPPCCMECMIWKVRQRERQCVCVAMISEAKDGRLDKERKEAKGIKGQCRLAMFKQNVSIAPILDARITWRIVLGTNGGSESCVLLLDGDGYPQ